MKQFRPAVRQTLTEIPAGLLDVEGEDALTCAARELFEETGYRHREIEFLGGYYASAGFTDEYVHLFWARTEAEPEGELEDGIEVIRMPFGQMVDAARAGQGPRCEDRACAAARRRATIVAVTARRERLRLSRLPPGRGGADDRRGPDGGQGQRVPGRRDP